MSSKASGFDLRAGGPHRPWESSALWMAPLLTVGLLALAAFVMFASCGAALI